MTVSIVGCEFLDIFTDDDTSVSDDRNNDDEDEDQDDERKEDETEAEDVNVDDIDYKNLVTDAYTTKIVCEDYYKDLDFAIPQINLDSADVEDFNEDMYDDLYDIIEDVKVEVNTSDSPQSCSGITYEWYYCNDILSVIILIDRAPFASPYTEYIVYNFSLPDGEMMSENDVIEAAGYDKDEYYDEMEVVLGNAYLNVYDSAYDSMSDDEFFVEQFNKTITQMNIDKCMPYIDDFGDLWVVAYIYAIAGGEGYSHQVNVSNYEKNPHYSEFA